MSLQFGRMDSIHLSCMLLAANVHLILGVSIEKSNFILRCIRNIVKLVLSRPTSSSVNINTVIRHLPVDVATALARTKINPAITVYACCPRCRCIYPELESQPHRYQQQCTWNDADGRACDAR